MENTQKANNISLSLSSYIESNLAIYNMYMILYVLISLYVYIYGIIYYILDLICYMFYFI